MATGSQVTSGAPAGALTTEDLRHLLRRLAFSSTPALERSLAGRTALEALDALLRAARETPQPAAPAFVQEPWTNSALRTPGMTDARYDELRAAQGRAARTSIDRLRAWWVAGMAATPAPLRETLTLFFHSTFGSTTSAVDAPQALYACNALLRRACTGTIPALLEALVLEPAMLIQTGMDEHRRVRVSDRPAKLILDHWTVGDGAYADADVEALSRALTGWTLVPPPGFSGPQPDPAAPRAARRTGLVPSFDAAQFDARSKTILGTTRDFDARQALRFLGEHPATAKRFARLFVSHFGIDDPAGRLEGQLAATYLASRGQVEALLRDMVGAPEFWSAGSRWALIKSPVHLAVGACRQLEISSPAVATIVPWLAASGQTLFDTPNAGEGGWAGDRGWVTPADRLAIRYQLPSVLSGTAPHLGFETGAARPTRGRAIPLGPALQRGPAVRLVERLDPAPGLDATAIAKGRHTDVIRRVMMTPQYQLA